MTKLLKVAVVLLPLLLSGCDVNPEMKGFFPDMSNSSSTAGVLCVALLTDLLIVMPAYLWWQSRKRRRGIRR
jgi:uncharacterized lipoprotein